MAAANSNPTPAVVATVYGAGGASRDAVSVGTLEGDPQDCPPYVGPHFALYQTNGSSYDETFPKTTWTLATVLSCLDVPVKVSQITSVSIVSASGAPEVDSESQLTQADLNLPSDFNDPSTTAVIYDIAANTSNPQFEYTRPWRDSPDANNNDQFTETANTPIDIEVFEGPHLTVSVSASRTTVAAGDAVSFKATVTGPDANNLSYSWYFGGAAAPSTAAAPQVTFANAGTYDVGLEVTNADGGSGSAPNTTITVNGSGPPPPTKTGTTTTPGGGEQPTATSPTGTPTGPTTTPPPGRGSKTPPGKKPGAPKPSAHRQRDGSSHHKGPHHKKPSGGASPSSGGSSGSSNSAATSPISSAPAPAPPAPAASHHANKGTKPQPRAPENQPSPPALPGQTATLVTGRLISDLRPLPLGASPLVHPLHGSPAAEPAVREAVRTSPLPVLTGTVAVMLLLALGAGRELRGRRALRFSN